MEQLTTFVDKIKREGFVDQTLRKYSPWTTRTGSDKNHSGMDPVNLAFARPNFRKKLKNSKMAQQRIEELKELMRQNAEKILGLVRRIRKGVEGDVESKARFFAMMEERRHMQYEYAVMKAVIESSVQRGFEKSGRSREAGINERQRDWLINQYTMKFFDICFCTLSTSGSRQIRQSFTLKL